MNALPDGPVGPRDEPPQSYLEAVRSAFETTPAQLDNALEELCTMLCVGGEVFVRSANAVDYVTTLTTILFASTPNDTPSPSATLAMRAIFLAGDMIPNTTKVIVEEGLVEVLINWLKKDSIVLCDAFMEELLKCLELLSFESRDLLLECNAIGVIISRFGLLCERLRGIAIGCVVNIFAGLQPCDWSPGLEASIPALAALFTEKIEKLIAVYTAMKNGTEVAGGAAALETNEHVLRKVCQSYCYLFDRIVVDESCTIKVLETGLVDLIMKNITSLLLTVKEAPQELPQGIVQGGLSVLIAFFIATPATAIEIFMEHNVFHLLGDLMKESLLKGISSSNSHSFFRSASAISAGHVSQHIPLVAEETSISPLLEFFLFLLPSVPGTFDQWNVSMPYFAWQWEDDFHNRNDYDESLSKNLEIEYQRQRRTQHFHPLETYHLARAVQYDFRSLKILNASSVAMKPFFRNPLIQSFTHIIASAAQESCECDKIQWKNDSSISTEQFNRSCRQKAERRARRNQLRQASREKADEVRPNYCCMFPWCRRQRAVVMQKKKNTTRDVIDQKLLQEIPNVDVREEIQLSPATRQIFLRKEVSEMLIDVIVPCVVSVLKGTVHQLLARHAAVILLRCLQLLNEASTTTATTEQQQQQKPHELKISVPVGTATALHGLICVSSVDIVQQIAVPWYHSSQYRDAGTVNPHYISIAGEQLLAACHSLYILNSVLPSVFRELDCLSLKKTLENTLENLAEGVIMAGDRKTDDVCSVHFSKTDAMIFAYASVVATIEVLPKDFMVAEMTPVSSTGNPLCLPNINDQSPQLHRLDDVCLNEEAVVVEVLCELQRFLSENDMTIPKLHAQRPDALTTLIAALHALNRVKPEFQFSSSASVSVRSLMKKLVAFVSSFVGLVRLHAREPLALQKISAKGTVLVAPSIIHQLQERLIRPLCFQMIPLVQDPVSPGGTMRYVPFSGGVILKCAAARYVEEVSVNAFSFATIGQLAELVGKKLAAVVAARGCTCSNIPGALPCDFCRGTISSRHRSRRPSFAGEEDEERIGEEDEEEDEMGILVPQVVVVINGIPIVTRTMCVLDAIYLYSPSGMALRKACTKPSESGRHNFWLTHHTFHFVVVEELPPYPTFYGDACLCDFGHTNNCAEGWPQYICSPMHLYREARNKKMREQQEDHREKPHSALELALCALEHLCSMLEEDGGSAVCGVEEGSADFEMRRIHSSLFHSLESEPMTFIVPSVAHVVHTIANNGAPESSIAQYALWNYPRIFSFPLRRALFSLILSGRKVLSPRIVLNAAVSPQDIAGGEWMEVLFSNANSSSQLPLHLRKLNLTVNRSNLLQDGSKLLEKFVGAPLPIEVSFEGEQGIGSGPTLEFFSAMAVEASSIELGIWDAKWCQGDTAGILFPTYPLSEGQLYVFKVLGRLVARALFDGRQVPLVFHPLFLSCVVGEDIMADPSASMALYDSSLEKTLCSLKTMGQEELASMDIEWVVPGTEDVPLSDKSDPKTPVSRENVHQFVDSVRYHFLHQAIQLPLQNFVEGLSELMCPAHLQLFSASELSVLITGPQGKIWKGPLQFLADVQCNHGYTADSPQILQLAELVAGWPVAMQRSFLLFVSGSSCLPLAGLDPKITFVRKVEEGESGELLNADHLLPTVNTCFNYVKLPQYSSEEILVEKVTRAVLDGQGCFALS